MAEERTETAERHSGGLAPVELAAQRRALRLMWPGMTSRQIADALGSRVTAGRVRQWQAGLTPLPQWVHDHISAHAAAMAEAIGNTKAGPGSQAGWRNVKGYQLNMRR